MLKHQGAKFNVNYQAIWQLHFVNKFNVNYQGAKIKEIRDLTGAQINVSQESLPDSNERTVEVKTLMNVANHF